MGGSLGPVPANIILTEFEHVIINPLINCGIIKFYRRYVDDTLQLTRHDDVNYIFDQFHSFDNNICFTYDEFLDEPPHFLDLNLDDNEFSIHRKPTFSGQYTHSESFVPWKHRTAWVRSLLSRMYRICSPSKPNQELQFIKRIASWNGFPKQVVSSIMTKFNKPTKDHTDNDSTEAKVFKPTLWFEMSYIGQKARATCT